MITQTTYNRLTVATFTVIIIRTVTSCVAPLSDGPVMAYELDGTWCQPYPEHVCLTVRSAQATGLSAARYEWNRPTCRETGELTGGLEFTPDTTSRLCVAPSPSLYSAAVTWTGSGLDVSVDGGEQFNLDYIISGE